MQCYNFVNTHNSPIMRCLLSCGLVISIAMNVGAQSLEDIDGEKLKTLVASYKNKSAVLVNVWATWCAPCVKEFPEIVKLQKALKDELQVIFISADFPGSKSDVEEFLSKQNVGWTTYFKNDNDQRFINALSEKWTGALPATLILAKDGSEVKFTEGLLTYEEFEKYAKIAISTE